MKKIILCGANGKIGHVIRNIVAADNECEIVAGVDINTESTDFPIYSEIDSVKESADVIIDFSNPALLNSLLEYSAAKKIPVVIATTGFDDDQKKQIENAATENGVFFTYNMSLGINLLATLAKKAVDVLGNDFDIEIIEKHHNQKIDAPSGTAVTLAEGILSNLGRKRKWVCGTTTVPEELEIAAIRRSIVPGTHTVTYESDVDSITMTHTAKSRRGFALGAVLAAEFLRGKKGVYSMEDLMRA